MDIVGLRELVAANPEHIHLEEHGKPKEVKKEPALNGTASLSLQPADSLPDTKEEFYDALMVEDPEEEEEDDEAQGMFSKRTVGDKSLRTFHFSH
jgi:hypothetical protein